jgi:hypothetical protein
MDFLSEQIMSNNSVPRCATGHYCVVSEAIILSMAAYTTISSSSMLNEPKSELDSRDESIVAHALS